MATNTPLELETNDGHTLSTYVAGETNKDNGTIVVIQEIFGVNSHIRNVCDQYAKQGYRALAPALFDRVEAGIELGYGPDDMSRGIELAMQKLSPKETITDIQCAIDYAAQDGPVGLVGYCFGGTMAWVAAARCKNLDCAVSYYGGNVKDQLGSKPQIPIILHFGNQDPFIPLSDVEKIKQAYPKLNIYQYEANHGFNCEQRDSYHQPSAELALERSLDFFHQYLK